MKFGEKLECYAIADWSDKYIKYKVLKKLLKRLRDRIQQKVQQERQYAAATRAQEVLGDNGENMLRDDARRSRGSVASDVVSPSLACRSSSNFAEPVTSGYSSSSSSSSTGGGMEDRSQRSATQAPFVSTAGRQQRGVYEVPPALTSCGGYSAFFSATLPLLSSHNTAVGSTSQSVVTPLTSCLSTGAAVTPPFFQSPVMLHSTNAMAGVTEQTRYPTKAPLETLHEETPVRCTEEHQANPFRVDRLAEGETSAVGVVDKEPGHPTNCQQPKRDGSDSDQQFLEVRREALDVFAEKLEAEMVKVEDHFFNEKLLLEDRLVAVDQEMECVLRGACESEELNSTIPLPSHEYQSGSDAFLKTDASSPPSADLSALSRRGSSVRAQHRAASAESIKALQAHLKRLQKGLLFIWECIDKIESFVKLNTMALYKILKKRDKLLGIHAILTDMRSWRERLSQLTVGEVIKEKLLELYRRAAKGERDAGDATGKERLGAEETDEVETLEDLHAVVQKDLMKMVRPNYAWVACFLGACSVLLLDIIVMCYIPPTNPDYDLLQVLAVFPIYRIVLMIILLTWFTGAAMSVMEQFGVNYRFMLEIDPKCQVNASMMFTLASLQTTMWIVAMGLFLVDYKFVVFGDSTKRRTYYWIYPTLLLVLQLALFFAPNRTFRFRYRKQVLSVLWVVLLSGVCLPKEITLVQNVMGDILTSLAHPLGDVEYVACYYSYGLSPPSEPAKCPRVDGWMKPVIFALPFYLRLCQCCVRYKREKDDSKHYIHAANMGKYVSGIAVVICASFPWHSVCGFSETASRMIWVLAYVVATVYMFVWDMYVDWGFTIAFSSLLRPGGRFMYPRWIYYCVAVMNLFGRTTWAMTLMPIEILADKQLNATLIALIVSTIEIMRRSAWTVLRLENEHLTNSSRYRAMLWVPRLTAGPAVVAPSASAAQEAVLVGGAGSIVVEGGLEEPGGADTSGVGGQDEDVHPEARVWRGRSLKLPPLKRYSSSLLHKRPEGGLAAAYVRAGTIAAVPLVLDQRRTHQSPTIASTT